MTNRVDLSALDALAEAATEGPWVYETDDEGCSMGWICVERDNLPPEQLFAVCGDSGQQCTNAEAIVCLRNAYPALAAELRALRAALEAEKRLHIAALMLTGDLKLLLSAAHEDVCSLSCRSHFPAGHVHSDDDHSEKCRTLRAALGSQP